MTAGRPQLDVPQAAAQRVADVPYDEAQTRFRTLTGVGRGSERMPTCTQQATPGLTVWDGLPSRVDIEQRLAHVAAGRPRRPVVVLGVEGACVATRPDRARTRGAGRRRQRARRAAWRGQWRNAKGLRLSGMDGTRIVHLVRGHQGQSAQAWGAALPQVQDAGILPQDTVRFCVVADGAAWIWKHGNALFPQARQVLDDSHYAEYIPTAVPTLVCYERVSKAGKIGSFLGKSVAHTTGNRCKVAQAQYGTSPQALAWAERTMTRLSLGKMGHVLGSLGRMPATSDEAAKAMANYRASLTKHRGRTHDRP